MIYFLRHGQTDWNLQHKLQGSVDTPLNETGISQAHKAKGDLKDVEFDMCFSSPLQRAKKTAEVIFGDKVITDERIIERNFGVMEGEVFHNFDDVWNLPHNVKFENGESANDVKVRAFDFIDEMRAKYKNKTVLVVCHGGIMRVIQSYFIKDFDGDYTNIPVPNNCEALIYDLRKISACGV
ncbi:MAG: histidine phosphatase family protein [Firmicutes bacterium]|nr:histidine phosphatase family protein [Bacillota bacterium]